MVELKNEKAIGVNYNNEDIIGQPIEKERVIVEIW